MWLSGKGHGIGVTMWVSGKGCGKGVANPENGEN